MIKINLLPPELRGKKASSDKSTSSSPVTKSAAGSLIVAGVVTAVVVACGVAGFSFWSKVSSASNEVQIETQKTAKLQKQYDTLLQQNKDIKSKWDIMKIQEEILSVLVPDKPLLWSEKINMLSNLIPSGVYMTELVVDEKSEMVETEHSKNLREEYKKKKAAEKKSGDKGSEKASAKSSKPGSDEPAPVKKPRITQTLTVKAISTGKDQNERFDKMLEFEKKMRAYTMKRTTGEESRFMDNFAPDIAFGMAETGVLDGKEVWLFEFKLTTTPMGDFK